MCRILWVVPNVVAVAYSEDESVSNTMLSLPSSLVFIKMVAHEVFLRCLCQSRTNHSLWRTEQSQSESWARSDSVLFLVCPSLAHIHSEVSLLPELGRQHGEWPQFHLEEQKSLGAPQKVLEPLEVLPCRSIQGSGQFLGGGGTAWPETYLAMKLFGCSSGEPMSLLAHNLFHNLWRRRGRRAPQVPEPLCNAPYGTPSEG